MCKIKNNISSNIAAKKYVGKFTPIIIFVLLNLASPFVSSKVLIFESGTYPLSYDIDGEPKGVYLDIVSEVFNDMNEPYSVVSLPFKRALYHTETNKGIVVGVYKTRDRLDKLDFSEKIYTSQDVLFVRKDSKLEYSKISDLKGKKIAVKLGWSYGHEFDRALERGEFTTVHGNSKRNFKLLLLGRIDAFIETRISGINKIKELGIIDSVDIINTPVNTGEHHLAVKKGEHKELIENFNEHLRNIRLDGRYDKIISGHIN
ncbi:transporter substrate-binding domain-containing protein [Vibrio profundum]|uniref:substrate-binding periplasmic protein n=1 Tax=Vibrio profundum TaxID=2910247 RepID=UPI003D0B1B24